MSVARAVVVQMAFSGPDQDLPSQAQAHAQWEVQPQDRRVLQQLVASMRKKPDASVSVKQSRSREAPSGAACLAPKAAAAPEPANSVRRVGVIANMRRELREKKLRQI